MSDTPIAAIRARLNLHSEDEFVRSFAPLVSAGGMFLKTRQLKPVGATVRFDFSLSDGERLLFGEGVVKQVKQATAANPGAPTGMLIKFTKLNRASKALVSRIVAFKKQAEAQDDALELSQQPVLGAPVAPPPTRAPQPQAAPPAPEDDPGLMRLGARVAPTSNSAFSRIRRSSDRIAAIPQEPPARASRGFQRGFRPSPATRPQTSFDPNTTAPAPTRDTFATGVYPQIPGAPRPLAPAPAPNDDATPVPGAHYAPQAMSGAIPSSPHIAARGRSSDLPPLERQPPEDDVAFLPPSEDEGAPARFGQGLPPLGAPEPDGGLDDDDALFPDNGGEGGGGDFGLIMAEDEIDDVLTGLFGGDDDDPFGGGGDEGGGSFGGAPMDVDPSTGGYGFEAFARPVEEAPSEHDAFASFGRPVDPAPDPLQHPDDAHTPAQPDPSPALLHPDMDAGVSQPDIDIVHDDPTPNPDPAAMVFYGQAHEQARPVADHAAGQRAGIALFPQAGTDAGSSASFLRDHFAHADAPDEDIPGIPAHLHVPVDDVIDSEHEELEAERLRELFAERESSEDHSALTPEPDEDADEDVLFLPDDDDDDATPPEPVHDARAGHAASALPLRPAPHPGDAPTPSEPLPAAPSRFAGLQPLPSAPAGAGGAAEGATMAVDINTLLRQDALRAPVADPTPEEDADDDALSAFLLGAQYEADAHAAAPEPEPEPEPSDGIMGFFAEAARAEAPPEPAQDHGQEPGAATAAMDLQAFLAQAQDDAPSARPSAPPEHAQDYGQEPGAATEAMDLQAFLGRAAAAASEPDPFEVAQHDPDSFDPFEVAPQHDSPTPAPEAYDPASFDPPDAADAFDPFDAADDEDDDAYAEFDPFDPDADNADDQEFDPFAAAAQTPAQPLLLVSEDPPTPREEPIDDDDPFAASERFELDDQIAAPLDPRALGAGEATMAVDVHALAALSQGDARRAAPPAAAAPLSFAPESPSDDLDDLDARDPYDGATAAVDISTFLAQAAGADARAAAPPSPASRPRLTPPAGLQPLPAGSQEDSYDDSQDDHDPGADSTLAVDLHALMAKDTDLARRSGLLQAIAPPSEPSHGAAAYGDDDDDDVAGVELDLGFDDDDDADALDIDIDAPAPQPTPAPDARPAFAVGLGHLAAQNPAHDNPGASRMSSSSLVALSAMTSSAELGSLLDSSVGAQQPAPQPGVAAELEFAAPAPDAAAAELARLAALARDADEAPSLESLLSETRRSIPKPEEAAKNTSTLDALLSDDALPEVKQSNPFLNPPADADSDEAKKKKKKGGLFSRLFGKD